MIYNGKTYVLVQFEKETGVCRKCAFGDADRTYCNLPADESNECTGDGNAWKAWQEIPQE